MTAHASSKKLCCLTNKKMKFEVNYEFLSLFFLIIQGICYWWSYKYMIVWNIDIL